jgi:hypothetical protein
MYAVLTSGPGDLVVIYSEKQAYLAKMGYSMVVGLPKQAGNYCAWIWATAYDAFMGVSAWVKKAFANIEKLTGVFLWE